MNAQTLLKPPHLQQARVLVVGDIMLDRYWFGETHRISPEAPVPVVRVLQTDDRLGAAANVARNAAALGARVGLLGVIGCDEPGEKVQALLQKSGITSYIHRDAELSTTIKLRVLARQQQLVRIDFENTPSKEVLSEKLGQFQSLLADYDVVLLSDYAKGGLTHVADMIHAARAAGKWVLVDPKGADYARYQDANILTPNRAELREVIGAWQNEADLQHHAENLRARLNLDALLLTRSEEGMTLFEANQTQHFPAEAREVFDVSGAGDTVIATLAVMLAAGLVLPEAVRIANRAGAIVVGKLGTAVVSQEELFANTL